MVAKGEGAIIFLSFTLTGGLLGKKRGSERKEGELWTMGWAQVNEIIK